MTCTSSSAFESIDPYFPSDYIIYWWLVIFEFQCFKSHNAQRFRFWLPSVRWFLVDLVVSIALHLCLEPRRRVKKSTMVFSSKPFKTLVQYINPYQTAWQLGEYENSFFQNIIRSMWDTCAINLRIEQQLSPNSKSVAFAQVLANIPMTLEAMTQSASSLRVDKPMNAISWSNYIAYSLRPSMK